MKFTSELSLKIRTAIKVKLAELGNDVYEELPDYIMVMIANRKDADQMTEDLTLFLGDSADQFTTWLQTLLSKLQSVASTSKLADGDEARPAEAEDGVGTDPPSPAAVTESSPPACPHGDPHDACKACRLSAPLDSDSSGKDFNCDSYDGGSSPADADSTSKVSRFSPSPVAGADSTASASSRDKVSKGQKRKSSQQPKTFKIKMSNIDNSGAGSKHIPKASPSVQKKTLPSITIKSRTQKFQRTESNPKTKLKSRTRGSKVSSSVPHSELSAGEDSDRRANAVTCRTSVEVEDQSKNKVRSKRI